MSQTKLIIGHASALRYWRGIRLETAHGLKSPARPLGSGKKGAAERVALAKRISHSTMLDVVFPTPDAHFKRDDVKRHVWSGPMTNRLLVPLGSDIYVCRPQLAFVQFAERADVLDLAAVAYELTGAYALTTGEDVRGEPLSGPLVTVSDLEAFARRCHKEGVRGGAKAEEALALVKGGSSSLLEAQVALIASISRALGGFGLRSFELNPILELPESAALFLDGQPSISPEFLWRKSGTVLECASSRKHAQDGSHEESRRRYAYTAAGYQVISLTDEQANCLEKLSVVMAEIARNEGIRRPPMTSLMRERLEATHARLFQHGFDPLASDA